MKKAVSIFFSALIFACSLSDMAIAVFFKINQQSIASTICVNRNKPEKKCAGKCFFKNIFEEKNDDDNSQSNFPNVEDNFKINLSPSLFSQVAEKVEGSTNSTTYAINHFVFQFFSPSLLRPPIQPVFAS